MNLFRVEARPPQAARAMPVADLRGAFAVCHGDTVYVQLDGRAWRVERIDPTVRQAARGADGQGMCLAPMPGVVVSHAVQVGQAVSRGDALLVIESMKLQATIGAPHDGTVAQLPLAIGQTFERGALLARIEAAST